MANPLYEAAIREFQEETNVTPQNVHLKGVYTMIIKNGEQVVDEWMLYTFIARGIEGTPYEETREGKLEWHPIESLQTLTDGRRVIEQIYYLRLIKKEIQYGTFEYTEDFELISESIQSSVE